MLIAAKKASKVKRKVVSKSFSFENSKEELLKDLSEAEKIYEQVKGEISDKKLLELERRIEILKEKLTENEAEDNGFLEFEGMNISTPTIHELEEDLADLDDELGITKPEDPRTVKITTSEPVPADSSFHVLNLPPPPKK